MMINPVHRFSSFFRVLSGFVAAGVPALASAHPVSFQGADIVQFFSDDFSREAQVYHSVTSRLAAGGRFIDLSLPGRESRVGLLGVNTLFYRWNAPESQANIYFSTGIGAEKEKRTPRSASLNALFEADADWESRHLSVAGAAKILAFSSLGPVHTYSLRAGIAPYAAEYGELQSWLILEASRVNESGISSQLTPIIRLFYRNILIETGRSFDGMWKFNFMVHL